MQQVIVALAVGFSITCVLLIHRSVARGRVICDRLAREHPALYAAIGQPRVGYFASGARSRFDQFLFGRGYRHLEDPDLVRQCEALRRFNLRLLLILLSGFGLLGAAMLALRAAA